jgi:hypothetical protein
MPEETLGISKVKMWSPLPLDKGNIEIDTRMKGMLEDTHHQSRNPAIGKRRARVVLRLMIFIGRLRKFRAG